MPWYSDSPAGLLNLFQAPIVIFNDADPVAAANGVAFASFVASGQTCVSGTRIIVQEEIYDEFMLHFMHKVESIRIRMGNRKFRQTFDSRKDAQFSSLSS